MRVFWAFIIIFLTSCVSEPVKPKGDASLRLEIAIGHIRKTNYPLALKELLIAQDLDPKNPSIQSYLGFIYFVRERYDLAEEHYKRAIKYDPNFSDAKNNLARVYIETNQLLLADKLLSEVLTDYTYSDFPRAYLNKGILEHNRKNFTLAIEFIRKSLSTDRDNCISHVYLGRSYLGMNDLKMAISQLDRSISFCKPVKLDEAHYYSAIAYYRAGDQEVALSRFEELIKIFPEGKNVEKARQMIALINKGGP